MTVAIVINDDWEIAPCLPWAARFASARDAELLVIVVVPPKSTGDDGERRAQPRSSIGLNTLKYLGESPSFVVEPSESAADSKADDPAKDAASASAKDSPSQPPAPVTARVIEIATSDESTEVLAEVAAQKIAQLVLPRHLTDQGLDPETAWEVAVLQRATCETVQLRPGRAVEDSTRRVRILVPADGDAPSQYALRMAETLRDEGVGGLTALYIEPDVDDFAADVGRHIAAKIVRRTLGEKSDVLARTLVHSDVAHGVIEYSQSECDLVVVGARRRAAARGAATSTIPDTVLADPKAPTVAVVRPGHRLTSRWRFRVSQRLRRIVPQLDRLQRVSLVEQIQGSSQWDFDFVALIFLSTLIAALGLMQNSAAVVIGAMLVAPLMTPLVGAGLAVVQGNRQLIVRTCRTVLYGFLLAYFLGIALGLVALGAEPTNEMLSRGSPNVLDLIVAFLSGIAASYAMTRPSLLSALPGVAIAAALVPPVATAGLATAIGERPLAAGALLLFLTNIVAIVLGTAASLWAVGIRPTHDHGVIKSWVFRLVVALLILAAAIGAFEAVPRQELSSELKSAVQARLPGDATLIEARRTAGGVHLVIANSLPLSSYTVDSLSATVKRNMGTTTRVSIETRLIVTTD
jgi:uncharacterized hydrophobic protein (TIGR00271 family)